MQPSDEFRQWIKARTLFLGTQSTNPNRAEGLRLARMCPNIDDARWLCSLFPEEHDHELENMRSSDLCRLFHEHGGEPHARRACFAALAYNVAYTGHVEIRLAAAEGYPFAQAIIPSGYMLGGDRGTEIFRYIENAAAHFEPQGLFRVAMGPHGIYYQGDHTLPQLKLAAELGHAGAMFYYGVYGFHTWDPIAYEWLDKSARAKHRMIECAHWMMDCVKIFEKGHVSHSRAVYAIGRIMRKGDLSALPNYLEFTYHGRPFHSCVKTNVQRLVTALAFYDRERIAARERVDAWTIIARRLGVVKDIRRVIGNLIWEDRANNVPLKIKRRRKKKRACSKQV